MTGQDAAMGGLGRTWAHPLGSQDQPIRMSYSPRKGFIKRPKLLLSFIKCPGGWSQTILQVKKSDVEVLSWHGYTVFSFEAGWKYCKIL
jgi:hypothetical protein